MENKTEEYSETEEVRESVDEVIRRAGRPSKVIDEETRADVYKMYLAGVSMSAIGRYHRLSVPRVRGILTELGARPAAPREPRVRKGAAVPRACGRFTVAEPITPKKAPRGTIKKRVAKAREVERRPRVMSDSLSEEEALDTQSRDLSAVYAGVDNPVLLKKVDRVSKDLYKRGAISKDEYSRQQSKVARPRDDCEVSTPTESSQGRGTYQAPGQYYQPNTNTADRPSAQDTRFSAQPTKILSYRERLGL